MNFNQKNIFTEKEIQGEKGIVFNPESMHGDPNPINPNTLLDMIIEVMTYMATKEMMSLRKKDENLFRQKVEDKFPYFTTYCYGTLQMILSGADLSPLEMMVKSLDKIRKNKEDNFKDVETEVGAKLADRYFPKHVRNDNVKFKQKK